MTKVILLMAFVMLASSAFAQGTRTISGVVLDEQDEPVIGATVVVEGTTNGIITDFNGEFSLNIPDDATILSVSFIGMQTQKIELAGKTTFNIVLVSETELLDDVIVVGYGQQKKESVVGAITQTTGEVLERSAGVSNVGAALTGNLPGVTTMASSGLPGEEEPQIIIRSASSWNGSEPLVLVDGIQRPMGSVDVSSVESISVLKDASATAVFGVQGANGVILITTKRGKEGSAKISVSASSTMKVPSKLPNKLDAYDALRARNVAIEHELGLNPDAWDFVRSQEFIDMYRNQTTQEQRERYPNVDWQDALFKDYAMAYNANLNISGGTKFVKYFAAADYAHEGDLFKLYESGRGYDGGYGYDRLNVRSNLDFQITKSTILKVNLSGSTAFKKSPWNESASSDWSVAQQWAGAYRIAPDVYLPKYDDGSWGYYPAVSNVSNSAEKIALGGAMTTTTTRINTDFVLEQKLDFITKGLSVRGTVSWDNNFVEWRRGVQDQYNDPQRKYIDPLTGVVTYESAFDANNNFDFAEGVKWTTNGGEVDEGKTTRNIDYQAQINWGRDFGNHHLTAMGLFGRKERAIGNMIPIYREDWVFRATYDFASKYFLEYNGAYNGSEKFGADYRFGFFNSGAIGWMISEESFMKGINFLDMLKLRASYGEIGDDLGRGNRFLYMSEWAYDENRSTAMDVQRNSSPYSWYREVGIGNPDVSWETVKKINIGVDYAFLEGLFAGNFEYFQDKRSDILINGSDRAVPVYFGAAPPTANFGEVHTKGYEFELRINKVLSNGLRLWANMNMTHAENEIIERDDPELLPDYQKLAGYSIGQSRLYVDNGYINNYDQLYGSPQYNATDNQRLPGDYFIIDFNGDGIIDSNDRVPYGFSNIPLNTYNATLGFEWKGFSAFVQFYGVNNVSRSVPLTSFGGSLNTVYDMGSWWSKDNMNGDVTVPRYMTTPNSQYDQGTQYLYDGSYIRLKNAEIAYSISRQKLRKIGLTSMKIYINGNNLWVKSDMPDDRESNFAGSGNQGAYPTMKRYCLGVRFTL
ncbi:SusC/RagA family TonB-linked outer membrane protein [Plebeiibacterium sediminum]|uniref:TonB-dependent receptor n=1 Tax=Plebeiibacterium sediminum TaxID=2992112 RepID=A0AAE3M9C1_9BACT|nr:TonB-dependent receptor [Plebeiobacterium sediminum]MCW3788995.1 TonB-dependent receptor [Plebeiobacterium sediminum]